ENTEIYAMLTLRKTEELASEKQNVLLDLSRVQGVSSYILLMYLFKNKNELYFNDELCIKIVKMLISFFVRRNITDMPPTRDIDRIFMSFIEEIMSEKLRGNDIYNALRERIINVSASDESFRSKLEGPVYEDNSDACRFILCSLAQKHMNKENYIDLWQKSEKKNADSKQYYVWTIEHIFPQGKNIPESWVEMIAKGDVELAKELQARHVHQLGNLTITAYNSNLGNMSFKDKRDRMKDGNYIGYKNGLSLNDWLKDKEKWEAQDIKDRTDYLIAEIIKLFPL
ncbi:MAG: HNH endonuclease, partial [Deltaproteobacteria bacterium]|nr:HNH endonuclease [Deltaproteobacteria bacterium]